MIVGTIKIFEPDLTFVGIIDNYQELQFQRKFFTSGTFILKISAGIKYVEQLTENRIIMISNNVNKVGVIKEIKKTTDNKVVTYEIKGRELKGIFLQRTTVPTSGQTHQSFSSTAAETVIKNVVKRNCVDLTSYLGVDLSFPLLEIETDLARGNTIDFNTRYKNLESELETALRVGSLGSKLFLDLSNEKWKFDIDEGLDLTAGGPALNPVIFSTEYDNLQKQIYVKSNLNVSNFAIVGGSGEGVSRAIQGAGSSSNTSLDLYVTFIDAKDLSTTSDLIARGEERLSKLEPVESFDCDILTESNYTYEEDYDLGDVVTIRDSELQVQINKRIEGVTEFYSGNGTSFNITLQFSQEIKTMREYVDTINNESGVQ